MPGKRAIFTPLSILFRPRRIAEQNICHVVEAPGTAPGSNEFISPSVYYHSWKTSACCIGCFAAKSKGNLLCLFCCRLYPYIMVGGGGWVASYPERVQPPVAGKSAMFHPV